MSAYDPDSGHPTTDPFPNAAADRYRYVYKPSGAILGDVSSSPFLVRRRRGRLRRVRNS